MNFCMKVFDFVFDYAFWMYLTKLMMILIVIQFYL